MTILRIKRRFFEQWGNPTDAATSNARRTIVQNSASFAMACVSVSSVPNYGKWYAEIELSDTGNFLMAFGLAKGLPATGSLLVAAARANGLLSFVAAGVTSASQVTFTAGRMMLAIDSPGRKMWLGRNNSWFSSGNPAGNANPYYSVLPVADSNGQWRLFVHADNDGSGVGTATLHTKASNQSYSPPSGFLPLCTG